VIRLITLLACLACPVFAHEGHDEQAVRPPEPDTADRGEIYRDSIEVGAVLPLDELIARMRDQYHQQVAISRYTHEGGVTLTFVDPTTGRWTEAYRLPGTNDATVTTHGVAFSYGLTLVQPSLAP
jgi:hypothetical protein